MGIFVDTHLPPAKANVACLLPSSLDRQNEIDLPAQS
jgi:hypothetical protein